MKELEMSVRRTGDGGYSGTCEELSLYLTASSIEDLKADSGLAANRVLRARGEHCELMCISFRYEFLPLTSRVNLPASRPKLRTHRWGNT